MYPGAGQRSGQGSILTSEHGLSTPATPPAMQPTAQIHHHLLVNVDAVKNRALKKGKHPTTDSTMYSL